MVGKKKRGHPDVEDLLSRPWCYYCERDFDDLKILISHQKAKHFKCERCNRRLNTAGGLSVHMNQVHKENLTSVDNSLPNRAGLDVEIFGMEGIPEEVVQAHNQRIIAGFYEAEANRRAATGNTGLGGGGAGGQVKKPKIEAVSDLKKRLAEHRARKAEQAAAGDSGGNTPMENSQNSQNSPLGQSPASFNVSPFPAQQSPYGATQGAPYGSFSQEPYAQPATAYQQPFNPPPFSGPPGGKYPPQFPPSQQYNPQSFPLGSYPPPLLYPGGPSPPGSFGPYQPPSHTPPQLGGLPNRPPSLPNAPGLPQRPSFGVPAVAPYQMQQLHQGLPQNVWGNNGWKDPNSAMSSAYSHPLPGFNGDYSTNASAVDDLIAGATREADDIDEIIRMAEAGIKPPRKGEALPVPVNLPVPVAATPEITTETDPVEKSEEKKPKKDKPIKMIYSDNDLSPEERMALLPRYAFNPAGKTESSLVGADAMSGVVESGV